MSKRCEYKHPARMVSASPPNKARIHTSALAYACCDASTRQDGSSAVVQAKKAKKPAGVGRLHSASDAKPGVHVLGQVVKIDSTGMTVKLDKRGYHIPSPTPTASLDPRDRLGLRPSWPSSWVAPRDW